tara:strand:- start:56 stop:316 length:261 start_codon:yes stop_codon:yes gene_type:complete
MYKSLLTKIDESDIPISDYLLNYLDDKAMEYLEKVYEENKSVSYETWEELKDNVYISMLQGGYPFRIKDEVFHTVEEWIGEDYGNE